MKLKKCIAVLLVLILSVVAVFNITNFAELKKSTSLKLSGGQYQVTVKDYASG